MGSALHYWSIVRHGVAAADSCYPSFTRNLLIVFSFPDIEGWKSARRQSTKPMAMPTPSSPGALLQKKEVRRQTQQPRAANTNSLGKHLTVPAPYGLKVAYETEGNTHTFVTRYYDDRVPMNSPRKRDAKWIT
jgi:hypothetical protein